MEKLIPIEISAKHVHLSQDVVNVLFGEGHTLTEKRELSQPGQYLCEERVCLVGPKGEMKNVAVLGPVRPATQVEISVTDSRTLGVTPVLRESGNTAGSAGITITNADGSKSFELKEGVIVAKNHIHMSSENAAKLDVTNGEVVRVLTKTERPIVFEEVVCRVNDAFNLSMHIDFDEANACMCGAGTTGVVIKK